MSLASAVVAVGTSATLLNAGAELDRASGSTVTITNPSANAAPLFIGGAGVTTATGFPVPTGATLSLTLGAGEQVYGVLAVAGSANVLQTGL